MFKRFRFKIWEGGAQISEDAAKEVNTDNHDNYLPFICNEMIIVSQFNRLLPCHLSVIRSPKH